MKKDIAWGYASQFLQYGAQLLVLPLLLRKLSSAELGVWYLLLTISMFVFMLDMGFTPTLARNVSYVLGGARKLYKDGYEVVPEKQEVDYGLMRAVIGASKEIFLWMSIIALVLLATVGTWFVLTVTRGQVQLQTVVISWVIFVLSTIVNLYFKYFTPLLQGRGLFAEFYRANAISSITLVISMALVLLAGFGLVGVAASYLISALVGRWLSGKYLYDPVFVNLIRNAPKSKVPTRELILTLWNNAWRMGLVVVGSFFVLRANNLVASAYLGLATTSTYALTLQVFSVISSASVVAITIQQQKMAQHRVAGDRKELLKLVELGLASSLVLYIAGAVLVVAFGNEMIRAIGGHTQMLDRPLVAWVAIMLLLELNHTVSASVIVTRNVVPFVKPSLISGAAVVISSIVGLHFFKFGVWWLVATQFFVQAAYNNWKWPLYLAKEFKVSYFSLLSSGATAIVTEASRAAKVLGRRFTHSMGW